MLNTRLLFVALALIVPAATVGCGGKPVTTMDAGADMGPVTLPLACEETLALDGVMGSTVSISGDTSTVTARAHDLGSGCGNPMAPRPAPQQIVAFAVPGTGPVALAFSLINAGTPTVFDTLVQVRTECGTIPEGACFDNYGDDRRSEGGLMATGGETVYFVVTGVPDNETGGEDSGAWTLEITAGTNEAPVLVSADNYISDRGDYKARLEGTDADGNIVGFLTFFMTASGDPIDLDGDGAPDGTYGWNFAENPTGQTTFTGTTSLGFLGNDGSGNPVYAADLLRAAGAAQARITLVDYYQLESEPLTVPLYDATVGGVGATCNTATERCFEGLECDAASSCVPTAATSAACAGATALAIGADGTASVTGTILTSETGALQGSCTDTTGPEDLYLVNVPATGSYDLIATTETTGSASDIDTVLYLRGTCEDSGTELACHDDINGGANNRRSLIEVRDIEAGVHTIVVEPWSVPRANMPYGLHVRLRPVLSYGETCDPTGAANRCADGPCNTTTNKCPARADVTALCTGASNLAIAAPTTTTTTVSGVASLSDSATNVLDNSCNTAVTSAEKLFKVTVPAGNFDLIATTANTTTGAANTAIFVRSDCMDATSEVACNLDIDPAHPLAASYAQSSYVMLQDVAAGTYTFGVESEVVPLSAPLAVQLDVSLRPVLASGTTGCDPTEVDDRCASGPCADPGTGTPTCP